MVHSVTHQQTRAWHRTHQHRYRRAWFVMGTIVLASIFVATFGYFSGVPWPTLIDAVLHTTYRLIASYLIAMLIGVPLALIVGWSVFVDDLFPVFDVLQNIPSFALIPVFIYFLGYTDKMIILFAVSSIIWPILFSVLSAIKDAHTDLSDAAKIFGARGLRKISAYLAPLSFPSMITGSIVGIAIGWESVIGAEIIADNSGFGAFIKNMSATSINPSAIAGMLVILLIVFIINRLVWTPLLAESAKRYAE